MSGLFFNSGIDRGFEKDLNRMNQQLNQFGNNVENKGKDIDNTFRNLAQAAGGVFLFSKATEFAKQVIQVRGEVQQLDVALTTMLGSKEEANKLIQKSIDLAAKTPFQLSDISQGTKQLLAYGSKAGDVTEEIRMLGNIASGVSAPLIDIVYLYGTLRTQGVAYAQDIRQFAGRGIPIYAELAKVLGVATSEIQKLVSEGKVGFTEVEQAFKNMTSSGGQFNNLMEAQSKTLTGQISNLEDSIYQMFNEIGEASEGAISTTIEGVSWVIKNYKRIGKTILDLIAIYGTYKAALIAVSISNKIYAASQLGVVSSTNAATTALKTFGKTIAANPIGLLITALSIAVPLLWEMNEGLEDVKNEAQTIIDDISTEAEELRKLGKSENEIRKESIKSLEKQITYNQDIINILKQRDKALRSSTSSESEVTSQQIEDARTAMSEYQRLVQDFQKKHNMTGNIDPFLDGRTIEGLKEQNKLYAQQLETLVDEEEAAFQKRIEASNKKDKLSEDEIKKLREIRIKQLEIERDYKLSLLKGEEDTELARLKIIQKYETLISKARGDSAIQQATISNNQAKALIETTKKIEKEQSDAEFAVMQAKSERQKQDAADEQFFIDLGKKVKESLQTKEVEKAQNMWNAYLDTLSSSSDILGELVNGFGSLDNNLDLVFGSIANIIDGVKGMSQALVAFKAAEKGIEKTSAILFAVSTALKTLNALMAAGEEYQLRKTDELATELSIQGSINRALITRNELYEKGLSMFGDSPWKDALDSLLIYNATLDNQNKAIQDITKSNIQQIQTAALMHESIARGDIFSDSLKRATELEKAVAGIAFKEKDRGRFANFIGIDDKFVSLLDKYPKLIDGAGKLNEEIAKTILSQKGLSSADQQALENLLEAQKQMEESYQKFGEYISNIFGGVADDVIESFQAMYEGSQTAMQDIENSMSDMIENMTQDVIQATLLQPLIDQLNQVTTSAGISFRKGDITGEQLQTKIIKGLGDFYSQLNDVQPQILQAYENADRLAAQAGFTSAFNGESTTTGRDSAATRISESITEQTGTELVGRINALMLSSQRISENSGRMVDLGIQNLALMNQIKINTDFLPEIAANTRRTYQALQS